WIADEVLYQARIDPRRRTDTLTRAEIVRIRSRLSSVVATAVRVGADSDRFPPKWLFHTRWSKRLQSPVTVRGEKIRYLTVGGPNARNDFHIDPGDEIFYQLKGDITVRCIDTDGKPRDITVREGEAMLCRAGTPHCPIRPAGTWGLVIERKRRADERDGLAW